MSDDPTTRAIVRECSDEYASKWDAFLDASPTASFYHLYGWKAINTTEFGHRCFYLATSDEDEITGILPLVLVRSRLFGRILCSMPFVNLGGPCAANDATRQDLLRQAEHIANTHAVDYLEIRAADIVSQDMPTAQHKVSMTVSLDPDPETLWRAFSSKHRTNIRRVYKEGVHVESGGSELLDVFYGILAQSWRALGTPLYRKSYFRRILQHFPASTRIFVCYRGETPVATALNGYFKGTVEGMWAGALPEHRKLQPNYVLYWEMLKHACEQGCHHYHLGRSSIDSGAERFKQKWLAVPTQLYWQYYLRNLSEIPQLNVSNPRYQLAIRAWRKLPLALTMSLGPLIARSIP